ncbi:uncharacterized protein LOC100569226 [Acyrthosiphon pisum]|uniref:Uncharacterized protein n=1 Tax=Acyrthosiphon pisum TaxID=7029 RepID=A0A8R2JLF9_ACYPI|nr:uncharacterized protein LOC100569226 [Acyrthosiphon pisum]
MCDVVQQQIERVNEELKARDPEICEKLEKLKAELADLKEDLIKLYEEIKKLKAELADLKEDLIKLYEEIKKLFLKRFNELRDDIRIKTKPIVKRWTPIIKDIEEIILALIPEKKKEIKKNT